MAGGDAVRSAYTLGHVKGASTQTRIGWALGISALLLSTFSTAASGSAEWVVLGLAIACLAVGTPLVGYGWWLDRQRLLRKRAEETTGE